MKIVDLKCNKCGGNIKKDENNTLLCGYCGAAYLLEVPAPNTVINHTTINHYGASLHEEGDFSSEKEYLEYKEDQKVKRKLLKALGVIIFVFFLITALTPQQRFNSVNEQIGVQGEDGYFEGDDYSRVTKMVYKRYSEDDEMFKNITKMTNLEELYLFNASVLEDYSFLSRLPKLKVLFIGEARGLDHLDFIKNLKSLKKLEITKSNIEDLSVLKDNLSISELILLDNEKIIDYRVVSTLKSLEKLDVRANPSSAVPDTSNLEHLKEKSFVFSD